MIYSLPVLFLSVTILLYKCNCQMIDIPSESFKPQGLPLYKPKAPITPDCIGFPGSLQWNKCWARFHDDMANFQQNMEEYLEKAKKQANKQNSSNPNYYSNSYSSYSTNSNGGNSYQQSSNTVSVNGYYIRTNGLPVSTQNNNGIIKIIFSLSGPVEAFDHQVNGQEMELKMTIGGHKKYAIIKVPPKVKIDQLKIEKTSDVIQIIGPSGSDGGYNVNSFSSSGGGGGMPPGFQIPPPPKFHIPQIPTPSFQMPNFPSFHMPMNFPFRSDNMWFY